LADRSKLRVGDRIRLLAVPAADLAQRERERRDALADAGWTADTIERMLRQNPVVTVSFIDEYGHPWFEVELTGDNGDVEQHGIAIMDDESWERCS
jgi:hypothetical protein